MIPLGTRLDDTSFDALVALARRRLPALAPEWTDYNYHDPGITIVELLAWVADSQVYSLARNRNDERLAMARLLGAEPGGAIPGRGLLYPLEPPAAARSIGPGQVLKPMRDAAPRMETAETITLLPLEIGRLTTRMAGAAPIDHTAANLRPRAPFEPFGSEGQGELWIELKPVGNPQLGEDNRLSLGFELEPGSRTDDPAAVDVAANIEVVDETGKPLDQIQDSTLGLQRNGVLILSLGEDRLRKPIIVRPKAGYPIRPRLVQVMPNALPVEQRASFALDRPGNGRPGQRFELTPASLFDADEPLEGRTWRLVDGEESVRIASSDGRDEQRWKRGSLDDAGPEDYLYSVDERADGSRLTVRFGNGVNGKKPGLDDRIAIALHLSCGRQGAVRKPVEWLLAPQGIRWRNASAIGGGRDAQSVKQAISAARSTLRNERVLTTADELLRALAPLKAPLRIGRAEVEEGWEPGLRRPRMTATRTLIVGHELAGAETAEWLRAIRRSLAGRIAVGERLVVAPPRYVPFRIAVDAQAAPGADPATVAKSIANELGRRLRPRPIAWPLGRDVDPTAVAGWVRRLDGVGPSVRVRIIAEGREQNPLAIGRGALPKLVEAPEIHVREPRG